jgi:putative transposase
MLNVVDEITRECLTIRVPRKLNVLDVNDVLADLFIMRGTPVISARTAERSSEPPR